LTVVAVVLKITEMSHGVAAGSLAASTAAFKDPYNTAPYTPVKSATVLLTTTETSHMV